MAKQYSPKSFFRHVPNQFLQQYFSQKNVLSDFDFSKLSERNVDALYEAWAALSDEDRNEMERDFQEIDELAKVASVFPIVLLTSAKRSKCPRVQPVKSPKNL